MPELRPDLPPPRSTRGCRRLEIATLLILLIAAFGLRAAPISRVSMWWDELVHVQTASEPSLPEVVESVRRGIPPGFGNAGAVPLDYVLLHGWLRVAPDTAPEGLELRYRLPSLVWNFLTVLLTYLYARRYFDRGFALVATAILGLSVSHSLYAAEARSYSLFALMTIVNLFAFSELVVRRERIGPWVTYTGVAVLYFATGFTALLAMLPQYAILFILLLGDALGRPTRPTPRELVRLGFPLVSGSLVLGVVAAYLRGTYLQARYGRSSAPLGLGEQIQTALTYFTGGHRLLLAAFAAGCVLLPMFERRRSRESFAISMQLVVSFLAIPVIVELERWKEYYFHPRHAFFLFPAFALVASGGLLATLRGLDPLARTRWREATRHAAYVAISICLVVATQAGPIVRHLERPEGRFARTKTLRDFKSLVTHLRESVDRLPPGQVYLLLTERGRPGHIANPMLAKYLAWYGLEDRVVLRGVEHPLETLAALRRECPDGCVGQPAARVGRRLKAKGPFRTGRQLLELIDLAPSPPSAAPVGAVGLVYYWRMNGGPPRRARGFAPRLQPGLTLFEKLPAPRTDEKLPAPRTDEKRPAPPTDPSAGRDEPLRNAGHDLH